MRRLRQDRADATSGREGAEGHGMSRRTVIEKASASKPKVARARSLRRARTEAEELLWQMLRRRSLGVRGRMQHVIRGWIVDFYIPAKGLVIEVDGDIHDLQCDEDARRDEALRAEGLTVLRVRNEDVFGAMPGLLRRIQEHPLVVREGALAPPAQ